MSQLLRLFTLLFAVTTSALFSTARADTICTNTSTTSSSGTLMDSGEVVGNYSNNENCGFLIQPAGGGNITLSFSLFHYETGADFVRIYDGTNTSGTLLASYSGSSIPANVTATSGAMFVVSATDSSITRLGFTASWATSGGGGGGGGGDQICTNTSSTSTTGTLYDSGGSGGNYGNNENCQFLIQPGSGNITLSFSAFNYESNFDFLRVYDGTTTAGTLLGTFHGSSTPADVTATSGNMLIVSSTDSSVTRSGFAATWSTAGASSCPTNTVADNFPSVAYNLNAGSVNWSTDWLEIGESDGPSVGIARVRNDNCTSGNCLRIGQPSSGNSSWTNHGAQREVNLTNATSATLTFNYYTGYSSGTETVTLDVSSNGGGSWTTLQTYNITSTNFSATAQNFDLSSYISSNTRIRFYSSGTNATAGLYIDDLQISYDSPCTPVAEWRMDEISWSGAANEVVDNTGNAHHGTAQNGATTASTTPALVGNPGSCNYGAFDGSNDYVNVPYSADLNSDNFTVSFWARVSGGDGTYRAAINSRGQSGTERYGFTIYAASANRWEFWTGNVLGGPTWHELHGPAVTNNTWTHVSVSFEQTGTGTGTILLGTKKIYVNGTEVASAANVPYRPMRSAVTNPLTIGAGGTNGDSFRFTGNVDEARYYSQVLTAAQIQSVMNATHPCVSNPTPIAEWRMDEVSWNGTASEVVDNIGSLSGTANGGATTNVSGKICAAGTFDGSNDYVSASGINTYLRTSSSLSFWIKTTQTGNNIDYIAPGVTGVEQAGGTDDIFWGFLDASGHIGINKGDGAQAKSTTSINDGNWHHIVHTRDASSGEVRVYVNGSLEHSATSRTGDVGNVFSSIGRIEDTGGTPTYLQGQLDEVLIFSSVISASYVSSIYTNQNAGNNYDGSARSCPAYVPDHFLIAHDNNGIHCANEPVTVTARNADNSATTGYTGTITLNTQTGKGTWSLATGAGSLSDATANDGLATYTFAAGDNGTASFNLYYPEGSPSVNILVSDGAVVDQNLEGNITFASTGFTVTASALNNPPPNPINDPIGTQTAGTSFNLHLAAYGTTPTDSQCGVIETYTGNKTISLTTNKVNPSSGTINATGGGSITFTNGQAVVSAKYKDAGSINISASDGTISGGTGNFVVKPASLEISLSGSNQTAADHTGTVYTTAGSAFTATVTAKDSEGSTTPNFGNESPAESVALAHALAAPSGGASGTLSGSLSKTGSGIFSGSYSFSEVGIINLSASIADSNYLGTGNVTGTLNNVGRFTPHQFALGSLSNGALADECSADGGFTYTGQSFGFSSAPTFTVTAQNSSAATTTNYTGNYAKLSTVSPSVTAVTADGTTNGADAATRMAIAHTQAAMSLVDNSNGSHTYTLGADTFSYTRDSNARVGAFNSDVDISIASVSDGDSVSTTFGSSNVLMPTSTSIRYGRLSIANAIGSELLNLQMPVTVEVYNNSAGDFVPHTVDTCTTVPSYTITDPDATDGLNAATMTHSISSPISSGRFTITLNAPGAGSQGTAQVNVNAPTHLEYPWTSGSNQDPMAIGTFGLYSGRPQIIYRREIR